MDDFRKKKSNVLISTDVLERGVDVNAVKMVVNYDIKLDFHNKPDKVYIQTHIVIILLDSSEAINQRML